MHKKHRFRTIKSTTCPKCRKQDFFREKCTDKGCIFVQTRSIPCKCAEKHRKELIKAANSKDDYKRSEWHGM